MEFNIKVKNVMNFQEMQDWNHGKYFIPFKGRYEFKNWKLNIHVDCFNTISIKVYGYNGVCMGIFHLSTGYLDNRKYYPIMRFHNKLSFSDNGWVNGDSLAVSVDFGKKEVCELTLDKIFKAVEESWDKIKQFLQ